jgi:L-arabonate dehydrase
LRVYSAVGGSTNAVIHLVAIAGRLRVPLEMDDFDAFARTTPMLLDLQPSGSKLMADFDAAGGVPALMKEIQDLLHLEALTVEGRTLDELLAQEKFPPNPQVIRPRAAPLFPSSAVAILHGSLAPGGAVLRLSTASQGLSHRRCRALVFQDYADMLARIDDPSLPVEADTALVLRNAGAVGVPGLPEWGSIPVPRKLLKEGIHDILRISDARMSGTSYGTVVLCVTPEAAAGGPLALVEDGDPIELDVPGRALSLCVSEEELARRKANWSPPATLHRRGYPRLFIEHVLQPDQGCDFDFLRPAVDEDLAFVPPVV